jgi:hypothetical protein
MLVKFRVFTKLRILKGYIFHFVKKVLGVNKRYEFTRSKQLRGKTKSDFSDQAKHNCQDIHSRNDTVPALC